MKHLEDIQGFVDRIDPDKLYMNSRMKKIFNEEFNNESLNVEEADFPDLKTVGVKEDNIFNFDNSK